MRCSAVVKLSEQRSWDRKKLRPLRAGVIRHRRRESPGALSQEGGGDRSGSDRVAARTDPGSIVGEAGPLRRGAGGCIGALSTRALRGAVLSGGHGTLLSRRAIRSPEGNRAGAGRLVELRRRQPGGPNPPRCGRRGRTEWVKFNGHGCFRSGAELGACQIPQSAPFLS